MKVSHFSSVLAISTLVSFRFRSVNASAIAQIPAEPDGTIADDRTNVALISINDEPYHIPLGHKIIPTDIEPPPNVREASVDNGPQGFGCFFSERGNSPIGTFTVEDPIPRSPLPPKTPGDVEGTWPPVDNADTLTCFKLPAQSSTYLVWVLYANGTDYDDNSGNNFAIDVKEGIRLRNGGGSSSSRTSTKTYTPSRSTKEELVFIEAGSVMGTKAFKSPGRPIAKAMLVEAPYPQSVCLLEFTTVTIDQGESSSGSEGMKPFDLLEAAELEEGQMVRRINCFRGW